MHQRLADLKRFTLALLLALVLIPGVARADDAAVQTTWRLLDYVAVDYREAVQGGRVVNQLEYDEMTEFSATVAERVAGLPDRPQKRALIAGAGALRQAIARRAAPAEIERQARTLAGALLAAYPVPLAPAGVPDVGRGTRLYAEHCASCHGADGAARVPAAAAMDPPPIAFTDRTRARERSLFALYQVIG